MVQEWSAYAQTKTARHKLSKFLKDHAHLLEANQAASAPGSPSAEAASANGASSTAYREDQVCSSGSHLFNRLLGPASGKFEPLTVQLLC